MKKTIFAIWILFTLLVFTPETAFADSPPSLIEVRNDTSGVTFIFKVSETFSQNGLKDGYVQVMGGGDYELHCGMQDETTIICHASFKASGHNVVVGLGGVKFWTSVPEPRNSNPKYCYSVYDYPAQEEPETAWQEIGRNCQRSPAQAGDQIYFYNPYWGGSFYYIYLPDGVDSGDWENPGSGYYYVPA
ncbi:MAG TPA: hypothetical protein PKL78_15070 [Anaerolineales bacterium]|nr:hypothetical protein [Anaerolineales bacterium]